MSLKTIFLFFIPEPLIREPMTYTIESLIKGVWTPIDTFTSREVAELSLAIKRSLPKHFYQPHHLRIAPIDRLEQPTAKPEKQKQWKPITKRRLSEYIANSEAES